MLAEREANFQQQRSSGYYSPRGRSPNSPAPRSTQGQSYHAAKVHPVGSPARAVLIREDERACGGDVGKPENGREVM